MPRPRFQKLNPEKKAAMLEAAAREFAAHGFDGASLNHILEAAGVSKGAAYYYFDDKADLFRTVFEHYWNHLLEHAELDLEKIDARSFWPKVAELYRHSLRHIEEQPWILGMTKAVWRLPKSTRGANPTLDELFAWSHQRLIDVMRVGQRLGVVRTDLPDELLLSLGLRLDEVFDNWVLENVEKQGLAECERIAALLLDAARRVFEPKAGRR